MPRTAESKSHPKPVSDGRKRAEDQAVIAVCGLSCRGCAWRLHRAIGRADGVLDAAVNPFAETVSIRFDKDALDTKGLLEIIREAGLEPRLLRATVTIPELAHAPSAARGAAAAVRKIKGAESVSANPLIPGLFVAYDPQCVDVASIAHAVQNEGFTCGAVRSDDEPVRREQAGIAALASIAAALGAGVVVAARILELPEPVNGWLTPMAGWGVTLAAIVVLLFALSALTAVAPLIAAGARRLARGRVDESVLASLGLLAGVGAGTAAAFMYQDLTPLLAATGAASAVAITRWMVSRSAAAARDAEERGGALPLRNDSARRGAEAEASRRMAARAMPLIAAAALMTGAGVFFARASLIDALLSSAGVLVAGFGGALATTIERALAFALRRLHIKGIHVRDGEALENAATLRALVTDEETFYRPVPEVSDYVLIRGETQGGLLRRAAVALGDSENPIAAAIRARAGSTDGETPFIPASADPDRGVSGKVGRRDIAVGIPKYLTEQGTRVDEAADEIARFHAEGKRIVGVALDNSLAGLIALREPMREGARTAVESLRAQGVEVICATTDAEALANARAAPLAVTATTLLRERAHRAETVRLQMRRGSTGVAVARAAEASYLRLGNLGFALGDASPLIAAADVVLPTASPVAIAQCVAEAKSTASRVAKSRRVWSALQVVAVALPVAAGLGGIAAAAPFAAAAAALTGAAVTLQMSNRESSRNRHAR